MKKITKGLKFIFSGAAATALCLYIARRLLVYVWTFDIFSAKQWEVISNYWNGYGVISSGTDYLFFATLFLVILFWVWLWRYLYNLNLLNAFATIYRFFADRDVRKFEDEDSHVVIKNLSSHEKKTIEDVIQERLAAKDENKDKEPLAQRIRQQIAQKFNKK